MTGSRNKNASIQKVRTLLPAQPEAKKPQIRNHLRNRRNKHEFRYFRKHGRTTAPRVFTDSARAKLHCGKSITLALLAGRTAAEETHLVEQI
ncbi:MAG TPA: hypothetical protein VGM35_06325 [Xanthobacteraceae bacterium]